MKPRLLELFCGAGGAGMGYSCAGFDVTGVDISLQPHYPFAFIQSDALEYVTTHGHEYDLIHASPPCQAYTGMRNISLARWGHAPEHPDLIVATRRALIECGKPYIIENVQNSPLLTQVILCGVALGLPHLARHRHFESSHILFAPKCNHRSASYTIGVYGNHPDGRRVSYPQFRLSRIAKGLAEGSEVMGIDWMDWHELKEAIPPAYTEYLGKQLMVIFE